MTKCFHRIVGFLELDRYASLNYLPIIVANRFGDIVGQNIEVGFAPDLIALHLIAAFVFAVKVELLSTRFAEPMHELLPRTSVALVAEKMNHHPTWTNTWNTVSFELSTHDAGDIVTDLDRKLATEIDKLAGKG